MEPKYKALYLISQGNMEAREIAEESGLSYAAVLRTRKEYSAAVVDGNVAALMDFPPEVLAELVGMGEALVPELVGDLVSGVAGLSRLDEDFQMTALSITAKVRALVMSVDGIAELSMLTDCMCNLQKAFFNPGGTVLNIQNNVSEGGSKYGGMLNDKPTVD